MEMESNEAAVIEERPIDTLLTLKYSEMSEEEIARVIDYKAGVAAQQAEFKERQEQQERHQAELLAQAKAASDKAFEVQDALYQASLQRLSVAREGVVGGQAE